MHSNPYQPFHLLAQFWYTHSRRMSDARQGWIPASSKSWLALTPPGVSPHLDLSCARPHHRFLTTDADSILSAPTIFAKCTNPSL